MTNKREEMIEEAAKAMWEVKYGDVPPDVVPERTEVMQMARAALAVFEQSLTPTNDERVMSDHLRRYNDQAARLCGCVSCLDWLAESARRPVQGEPVGNPEQLEPTDAQAKAGLDAYFGCDFYADYPNSVQYHEPSMRRALRAAFATEQGENRG